jgi:hypothetical protein
VTTTSIKPAPASVPTVTGWRSTLPIHPAAELFPRMPSDELKALSEDIKAHGQQQPIAIIEKARRRPDGTLHVKDPPLQEVLDGISRLDAMEAAGLKIIGKDGLLAEQIQRTVVDTDEIDPVAFVISVNVHRRHLTAEQKRELIAKLIKATPEKSDRQIAETVKASPTTVGTVRAEMEAKGDVSKLDTRRDSKGRKQPARKAGKAGVRADPPKQQTVREQVDALFDDIGIGRDRTDDDVGPISSHEMTRKDARIEELQAEKRRLEIKIAGLESEVEEAKATAPSAERKSLAEKLEPLIEKLFTEGTKTMATMDPLAVMVAIVNLERLLVEHAIVPKSRRYENPQNYARAIRERAVRQRRRETPLPKPASDAAPPPVSEDAAPKPADSEMPPIPGFLDRTKNGSASS